MPVFSVHTIRSARRAFTALALLALGACGAFSAGPFDSLSPAPAPPPSAAAVTDSVWYITNRAVADDAWERAIGPWRAGVRTFNVAPLRTDRVTFELRLTLSPATHDTMAPALVVSSVASRLAAHPEEALLLHVHGYATSWDRATREAMEMKQRGGGTGPVLIFAWRAHDGAVVWPRPNHLLSTAYWDDTQLAHDAAPQLARAIGELVDAVGASRLVVSSHSMGGQLLASALADSALTAKLASDPLRALVFASPDVDRERFRANVAPLALTLARRVVLYATNDDIMLRLSAMVHAGEPRAGLIEPDERWPSALEVVDMEDGRSAAWWLGPWLDSNHAFRREGTAMVDLFQVVLAGAPAACREQLGFAEQLPDGVWRLTDAPLPPRPWHTPVQRADASSAKCRTPATP